MAGISLILVSAFAYTPKTPFPGVAALPPCLGAALILWANSRTPGSAVPTLVGKALSLRPLVFVGLISYSLYLWHWPPLAFSRYLALSPLSWYARLALVVAGFLLAVLSWRFVESPFREKSFGATRKAMFAYAGSGLAALLLIGSLGVATNGFPGRFSPEAQEFANAKFDMAFGEPVTPEEIRAGNLTPLGVTDATKPAKVVVWGDSHAMSALPAFDLLLKEKGIVGRAITYPSTAPVVGWYKANHRGLNPQAMEYNDAALSYIQSENVSDVVLIGYWSRYVELQGDDSDGFSLALLATVRQLAASGSRPWILLDVPVHRFNVPKALSRLPFTNLVAYCAAPSSEGQYDTINAEVIARIREAGGQILDPKPRFLDSTGEFYVIQKDGFALYRDEQHLTATGAKLILLPYLRESMSRIK